MVKKKNENVVNIVLNNEELVNQDETQVIEEMSLNINENELNIEDNDELSLKEQPEEVLEEEQPEIVVIEEEQPEIVVEKLTLEFDATLNNPEPKELKTVAELNYSQHRHYLRTGRIPK